MEILRWRTVAGLVIGAAIMVLLMFGAHRLQIGAVILSAATVSNMALPTGTLGGERLRP